MKIVTIIQFVIKVLQTQNGTCAQYEGKLANKATQTIQKALKIVSLNMRHVKFSLKKAKP